MACMTGMLHESFERNIPGIRAKGGISFKAYPQRWVLVPSALPVFIMDNKILFPIEVWYANTQSINETSVTEGNFAMLCISRQADSFTKGLPQFIHSSVSYTNKTYREMKQYIKIYAFMKQINT